MDSKNSFRFRKPSNFIHFFPQIIQSHSLRPDRDSSTPRLLASLRVLMNWRVRRQSTGMEPRAFGSSSSEMITLIKEKLLYNSYALWKLIKQKNSAQSPSHWRSLDVSSIQILEPHPHRMRRAAQLKYGLYSKQRARRLAPPERTDCQCSWSSLAEAPCCPRKPLP